MFTDPQLQALIEKGLESNVNMLNAALNVQMVEAQLKAAKLAFVPSFTFSPQGTIASWDGNKATKTYSLPITASWSVDLFGNLLNQKRSAQMNLLATKDYQLVVKTKLISNIANMYYTLLMLDKQLEVVDNMASLVKETWNIMKIQKELGRTKETSVQSAERSTSHVASSTHSRCLQRSQRVWAFSCSTTVPTCTMQRWLSHNASMM